MYHLKYLIPFFFLNFSCSSVIAQAQINEKVKAPIFKAAGFKNHLGTWQSKCSFGALILYRDLNGDRIPDALIKDGGSVCYPKVGVGFYLLSQRPDHTWHLLLHSAGEPKFLKTKGLRGWPDIQIVTKEKCQSIYRWDGNKYGLNRRVSDNMPCQTNQKIVTNKTKIVPTHSANRKSTTPKKPLVKNIKKLNQSIIEETKNLETLPVTDKPITPTKPQYQPPAVDVKTFQQFEEPKKSSKSLEDEIKIYKAFENLE